MNLREKLICLRKEKGLNQNQLSKKLDLSVMAIKKYESPTENRMPANYVLKKYTDFFGVSYDYLLNDNINNRTNENIHIEKILSLSDKAISNLKEYSHNSINLLLESDNFTDINNLLDFYFKFSYLSNMTTELSKSNYELLDLANGVKNIINYYKNFVKDNHEITLYSYSIEQLDDVYLEILDKNIDEDSNEDLKQEINDIYTTFENACKVIKLELITEFSKFLESKPNFDKKTTRN